MILDNSEEIETFRAALQRGTVKQETIWVYLSEVRRFLAWQRTRGRAIRETSVEDVRGYLSARAHQTQWTGRTASALRSFFASLGLSALCGPSVSWAVPGAPRRGPRKPPPQMFGSEEDFVAVCKKIDLLYARGLRDRAILELVHREGLGLGVVLSLRLSDLSLETRTLCGDRLNKRYRTSGFALREESCAWLSSYLEEARAEIESDPDPNGPLFPSGRGFFTRQGAWKMFNRYARLANVTLGRAGRKAIDNSASRAAAQIHARLGQTFARQPRETQNTLRV